MIAKSTKHRRTVNNIGTSWFICGWLKPFDRRGATSCTQRAKFSSCTAVTCVALWPIVDSKCSSTKSGSCATNNSRRTISAKQWICKELSKYNSWKIKTWHVGQGLCCYKCLIHANIRKVMAIHTLVQAEAWLGASRWQLNLNIMWTALPSKVTSVSHLSSWEAVKEASSTSGTFSTTCRNRWSAMSCNCGMSLFTTSMGSDITCRDTRTSNWASGAQMQRQT